jgi:protein TonB
MLEYIYKNLKYPAIARENGVEGQVVLQFVVDKDGSIADAKVVRDIGAGCGTEAEKVVNGMNNMGQKWIPGKQRGRPVRVLYTLPVKFKLEG